MRKAFVCRAGTPGIYTKLLKHTTYRVPVVPIVVIGRIHIGSIEVQVVHIGIIVPRRGPIVAV